MGGRQRIAGLYRASWSPVPPVVPGRTAPSRPSVPAFWALGTGPAEEGTRKSTGERFAWTHPEGDRPGIRRLLLDVVDEPDCTGVLGPQRQLHSPERGHSADRSEQLIGPATEPVGNPV